MSFGDKPFGLRDVKVTNAGGTTQVDLPSGRTFSFTERIKSGELSGDDKTLAVVAFSDAVEWTLEGGGISLEAYALMTGRTATVAGTAPNQTDTLAGSVQEAFPYFKVYGKAVDDATGDIHCKLGKCKLTAINGQFGDGEFFITQCSGLAIGDSSGKIFEFVQNETAANLPTS
jgi:hypothetical protein